MGVIPWSPLAGGWLGGQLPQGRRRSRSRRRAERLPDRFDLVAARATRPSSTPPRRSPQLAEEAGITLIHLALAFVLEHPAVTSAIIGPRTMEQLETQLAAADVRLDADVLDRIDEIVPPGTNLNAADVGWTPPALADTAARRRPRAT